MDLKSAQQFFEMGNRVNSIEVMATSTEKADAIKGKLIEVVGAEAGIYDWRQANSSFLTALAVERNVMFLIL